MIINLADNFLASLDDDVSCPSATINSSINYANRQNAIEISNYGPLNTAVQNPDYWELVSSNLNVPVNILRKRLCNNCFYFNASIEIEACIANGDNAIDEYATRESGDVGFCELWDFKASEYRRCNVWSLKNIAQETNDLEQYKMAVNQPRVPKGSSAGGQFGSNRGGAGGGQSSVEDAVQKLNALPLAEEGYRHFSNRDGPEIRMTEFGLHETPEGLRHYAPFIPDKVVVDKIKTEMVLDPSTMDIRYAQSSVVRAAVERKIRGIDTGLLVDTDNPDVVKEDGVYYLQGGHHRAAASIMLTGTFKADVIEVKSKNKRGKIIWGQVDTVTKMAANQPRVPKGSSAGGQFGAMSGGQLAGGLASSTSNMQTINSVGMVHQTHVSNVESISANGFAISHNDMYGKGVYFSNESSYTDTNLANINVKLKPHKQLVLEDGGDISRVSQELISKSPYSGDGWRTEMIKAGYGSIRFPVDTSITTLVLDPKLIIVVNISTKMAVNQPRVPKGSSAGGQFGAMSGSGAKQTDTAQFKEWFGNSKVVDENGAPLVMYHGGGSNEGFAHEFIGAGNALGPGFYFTSDPVTANMYADRQNVGGAVKPVFISVQNPMIVDTSSVTPKRLPVSTIESLITNSPRANPSTQQSASQQAHTAQTVKAAIAEYSNISELDAFFKIGNEFYGQGFNDTSNHFKSYLTNFTALTGYDGVIRRGPVIMSRVVVSAFQPQQIKSSVGNSGAFNANSPDITKMAAIN